MSINWFTLMANDMRVAADIAGRPPHYLTAELGRGISSLSGALIANLERRGIIVEKLSDLGITVDQIVTDSLPPQIGRLAYKRALSIPILFCEIDYHVEATGRSHEDAIADTDFLTDLWCGKVSQAAEELLRNLGR